MSGSSHSDFEEKEVISAKSHSEDFSEEREDNSEASRPPLNEKYYGSNDDIRPGEVACEDGAPLSIVPSKHSVTNIKSVPNGGTKAWLQVLGGFFIFFNTWGIVNAVSWLGNRYSSLVPQADRSYCSLASTKATMRPVYCKHQVLATSAGSARFRLSFL